MRTVRKFTLLTAMMASAALTLASHPAAAGEGDLGGFLGAHFFSHNLGLGRSTPAVVGSELRNQVLVGIRGAYLPVPQLSLEGEVGIIPTSTVSPSTQSPVVTARAHALWNILTGPVRPFILFGGGVLINAPSDQSVVKKDADGMFYGGVGVKWDITEHFGFRLDGRFIGVPSLVQTKSKITADYEVIWAFYGRIGNKAADRDKDGIPDKEDKCPKVAGPKENGGCPDTDKDNDGVVDRLDKCPMVAGLKELDGCPDPDTDGDGLTDRNDKCPTAAGPRENNGCPDVDTDGDGIVDRLDKCPNQAGIKELDGCPDPDSDGDGIPDRKDKCPMEPETKNGYEDDDGCPDKLPEKLKKFTGAIKGINFQPNKDIITKPSYPILDAAAAVLKEYPKTKMEISGHTDTSGDAAKNRVLSEARAKAVRNYLIGKGIEADRLTAVGFGPDKPVADNKTAAGRAKNRRVEFQLIQ